MDYFPLYFNYNFCRYYLTTYIDPSGRSAPACQNIWITQPGQKGFTRNMLSRKGSFAVIAEIYEDHACPLSLLSNDLIFTGDL